MKIVFLTLLLLVPVIVGAAGIQTITPQRVASLVKEGSGLWLVDVRNTAAFEEGHIEGAVSIPASQLAGKRFPKQKMIVLADDSLGLRNAREAAESLVKGGYERVFVLEGGLVAWQIAGYPLAGKGGAPRLRMVTPQELTWAWEQQLPMRVYDLRPPDERKQSPLSKAQVVEGKTMPERLERLRKELQPKPEQAATPAQESKGTTVIILPMANDDRFVERWRRDLPGDIRFLAGGYAAWLANPDKSLKLGDTCPTCPGGSGGTRK